MGVEQPLVMILGRVREFGIAKIRTAKRLIRRGIAVDQREPCLLTCKGSPLVQLHQPLEPLAWCSAHSPAVVGKNIIIVVHVHRVGQVELAQLAAALDRDRLGLGFGQGRQQQPSENGNDGDHHQQFDESEPPCGSFG